MKSPLLAALAALQLATLGLVVGLLLKRNDPAENPDIARLTVALQGALTQERTIIRYLDDLRAQAAMRASPRDQEPGNVATDVAPPPVAETTPSAMKSDPSTPFPEAAATLAELKRLHQALRQETKDGGRNSTPIKSEMQKRRDALLARGSEAIFVVRREVDLQPFEPGRDAAFVEYLLDEVVPALSSAAKDEAFDIARGALVRATNESQIKFAAAQALIAIDRKRWVKEVCDVIALGGASETDLRSRLLGLFEQDPQPEAVELCKRFLTDARQSSDLRTKAAIVIAAQDSSAVNPILRSVLFEDSAPILKIHALDGLWKRLKSVDEKRSLLEKVVNEDPARMPDSVQEKARQLLKSLDESK